jgi:hypothetical protein
MKYLFCLLFIMGNVLLLKAQQAGDLFFNQAIIHEIKLNFWQSGYWDSLTVNYASDAYMKCSVEIDGTSIDTIGVKFKGNSSYNNPSDKKPFKLDLNDYISGANIDGLKKLNLNNGFKDPSFLREKITLDFYNEHGILAPRCAYAKLYINNVYWGLYMVVEEIDKTFLSGRFNDNDGNLFKGDPQGYLNWIDSNPSSYYSKYELHTNETQNDWSDLVHMIDRINAPVPSFEDSIRSVLEVDEFIDYWAATGMFVNLDSYLGSGHNYFIYHDSTLNKFRWITWDVNESFGTFSMGLQPQQLLTLPFDYFNYPQNSRPLCNNIKSYGYNYYGQLRDKVCYLTYNGFSNEILDPKIDSLANAIRADVYADSKKFFSNQQFEDNIENDISVAGMPGGSHIFGIKSFIRERRLSLVNQMNALGCIYSLNELKNAAISCYPNPSPDGYYLVNNSTASIQYTITDLQGIRLQTGILRTGKNELRLNEKPGVYLLTTEDGKAMKMVKCQ